MVLCWEMEHARLRKQICTPEHCEHWPVLQGDPLHHPVMCDMSSIPTRFAGPLGRQRLTAAGKPHSEWPGGKYLLTPPVVFVKRCQNMHADSLIRTRLFKPPATAVPSGASPLTGPSCLLAEAESASEHACRLRSSCNSFLSVRSVPWPSEHVSPVPSRSPMFVDIETCHWHSFDQSSSMKGTAVTGSSPPAFLLGHQMAQVRSLCLVDCRDPAQILWN